jgi:hypothetical protein
MFVEDNQVAAGDNLHLEQMAIVRKFSLMFLISGIFGTAYMILSGFLYLGPYFFVDMPSYLPPMTFQSSPFTIIAFSSLIISYMFLTSAVFSLSNLYKKVYYSKNRRLFYRGMLFLYSAYAGFLTIVVVIIMIFGNSTNPNQITQLYLLILALFLLFTIFTFSLGILLAITYFALRSKSYYLILLAFLAAPDIYFIPIIAGALGYLMTSSEGIRIGKFLITHFAPKIRRMHLYLTEFFAPKIRRMQLLIKYLGRRRYKKYVYPALVLSILVTVILLYYSLISESYFICGYEFYYHPYFYGPDGIFNQAGIIGLLFFDFLFIRYLINSERAKKLIFYTSIFLAIGIIFIYLGVILFFGQYYPNGSIYEYEQVIMSLCWGLELGAFVSKPKTKKPQVLPPILWD